VPEEPVFNPKLNLSFAAWRANKKDAALGDELKLELEIRPRSGAWPRMTAKRVIHPALALKARAQHGL